MKCIFFFVSIVQVAPILSLSTSKQHAIPGESVGGVFEFVNQQHESILKEISRLQQEKTFLESDCQESINDQTQAVKAAEASVKDLSNQHEQMLIVLQSSQARLQQQHEAVIGKVEAKDAAAAVASEHIDSLKSDLSDASHSLESLSTFLSSASGSHTDVLQSIAQKLMSKLETQVASLQKALSNVDHGSSINEQSSQSEIDDLSEEISTIANVLNKSMIDASGLQKQLVNAQDMLETAHTVFSQTTKHCDESSITQNNLLQDQLDLRDTFSTIKTMLGSGRSSSFLQSDVVVKDVRAVKFSLQALAGKYQNIDLMRVVRNLDQPKWDMIFGGITNVISQLSNQIQTKSSEAKSFTHQFSLKNQQIFDLCSQLDQVQSDRESASQSSHEAQHNFQQARSSLQSRTESRSAEQKQIQINLRQNQIDLEQFHQNNDSLEDLLRLVQDRIVTSPEVLKNLKLKVQEARQDIVSSIENLNLETKQLEQRNTDSEYSYQQDSQHLQSQMVEFDAIAHNQAQMVGQSSDQLRLVDKQKVTAVGELQNFGHFNKDCTSSESSCQVAFDGCQASLHQVQDRDDRRVTEMETELQGVKDAQAVLKNIISH